MNFVFQVYLSTFYKQNEKLFQTIRRHTFNFYLIFLTKYKIQNLYKFIIIVGDGYIDLAEQNYEDAGWVAETYARRVKVECKDGNYFVTYIRIGYEDQFNESWDKDEIIIGWKRIIFN